MSDRTGLGPLEVALLEATAAVQAGSEEPVRTTDVLDEGERSAGYGPSYAFPVLQDLGAWWRTHLNLFDVHGNLGTVEGDPPADAKYTDVRLSPAGWLALGAEGGELGPVPLGLVNGTQYRGGVVPPLSPRRTIELLHRLVDQEDVPGGGLADLVSFPTRGTMHGDLDSLYAGHRTRMLLGSRIERAAPTRLVISGIPPGTSVDDVWNGLSQRQHPPTGGRVSQLVEIENEGRYDDPIRIVLELAADADVDAPRLGAPLRGGPQRPGRADQAGVIRVPRRPGRRASRPAARRR